MYEEYTKHVNMAITNEIKQFVKDDVFRNSEYLFYNASNDSQIAYCTKCKHEFATIDLHHNERGICPICGASVTAKSLRYGRKNCLNEACFYYFEKSIIDSNVVVCKGYYVNKNYAVDYKNPKVACNLYAIYIFENRKATMLKKDWWSNNLEKRSSVYDFNQGWLATKMAHCSFESIGKAIKGTNFQYLPYKTFQGYYSMVKLFEEYSKHPCIEYLVKEGLGNLVKNKLDGDVTHRTVNWNGKTIFKILKISKLDLREIKSRKVHVTFEFLKVFHDAKKQKWGLSIEEVIKIATEYISYYDAFKDASKYSSMKKLLKYLSRQYAEHNGTKKDKHYYFEGSVLNKFNDYIADCKLLGMDINRGQVLFPKDLYIAHQNTTKQIKIKENKKYDAQIKERAESLEKYIFQYKGYLIRPAKSSLDLIEEGAALNHCVATHYTAPYAKGETNIFLVRKISEPDKPFCTVEVKNNKVRQAYIRDDKVPDNETLKFIDIFKSEKLKNKKKIRIPA